MYRQKLSKINSEIHNNIDQNTLEKKNPRIGQRGQQIPKKSSSIIISTKTTENWFKTIYRKKKSQKLPQTYTITYNIYQKPSKLL